MIAVVTGAGRGIGGAIAVALAKRGCDGALLGRTIESLAETTEEVLLTGQRGRRLRYHRLRRGHRRGGPRVRRPRRAHVVIPDAGVVHRASVGTMSDEQWDEVIDVNLKGTFLVTRAFLPRMRDLRRGRFVAVASISATATPGTPLQSAYSAAKWGTVGFVKSLAEELKGTGLQAMCVMPGSVDKDMLKASGFAPAMQPEDVAVTEVFLALDAPAVMNASAVEMFGP